MRGERDRSLISAIRGPILLITVGVLFTLDHFTQYTFWDKTWPVLIIVVGLLSLMRRGFEQAPPPPPQSFPPPGYAYPQQTYPQQSYSQSTYSQPAPAKGGFGSSAATKPDAAQTTTDPRPPATGGTGGDPQ